MGLEMSVKDPDYMEDNRHQTDLSSPVCYLKKVPDLIRGVVFDLDGTFIDSTPAIVESFYHTFDTLGITRPAEEAIVTSIGHILEDQFALLAECDPHECVAIYRTHYVTVARELTSLQPGAEAAAARLREAGLKIGFATSKKREYAEMILDHLGMLDYFESRIGPHDVTHPKPHPEAILKSAEQLNLNHAEFFFVGDTDFDVKAAHAAKVRCLCVTTGYNTREQLEALEPELVVDSLDEITQYILAHRS